MGLIIAELLDCGETAIVPVAIATDVEPQDGSGCAGVVIDFDRHTFQAPPPGDVAWVTIENIGTLDDRSIQRIMREVEVRDLSLALKATPENVKDAILRNMSSRASAMLKEDMEASGPVRLRQVEEAQSRVVEVIRRLDEAEEIVIARGGDDELVG